MKKIQIMSANFRRLTFYFNDDVCEFFIPKPKNPREAGQVIQRIAYSLANHSDCDLPIYVTRVYCDASNKQIPKPITALITQGGEVLVEQKVQMETDVPASAIIKIEEEKSDSTILPDVFAKNVQELYKKNIGITLQGLRKKLKNNFLNYDQPPLPKIEDYPIAPIVVDNQNKLDYLETLEGRLSLPVRTLKKFILDGPAHQTLLKTAIENQEKKWFYNITTKIERLEKEKNDQINGLNDYIAEHQKIFLPDFETLKATHEKEKQDLIEKYQKKIKKPVTQFFELIESICFANSQEIIFHLKQHLIHTLYLSAAEYFQASWKKTKDRKALIDEVNRIFLNILSIKPEGEISSLEEAYQAIVSFSEHEDALINLNLSDLQQFIKKLLQQCNTRTGWVSEATEIVLNNLAELNKQFQENFGFLPFEVFPNTIRYKEHFQFLNHAFNHETLSAAIQPKLSQSPLYHAIKDQFFITYRESMHKKTMHAVFHEDKKNQLEAINKKAEQAVLNVLHFKQAGGQKQSLEASKKTIYQANINFLDQVYKINHWLDQLNQTLQLLKKENHDVSSFEKTIGYIKEQISHLNKITHAADFKLNVGESSIDETFQNLYKKYIAQAILDDENLEHLKALSGDAKKTQLIFENSLNKIEAFQEQLHSLANEIKGLEKNSQSKASMQAAPIENNPLHLPSQKQSQLFDASPSFIPLTREKKFKRPLEPQENDTAPIKKARLEPSQVLPHQSFFQKHWGKMLAGALIFSALVVGGVFTGGALPLIAGGLAATFSISTGVATGLAVTGTAAIGGLGGIGAGALVGKINNPPQTSSVKNFFRRHGKKIALFAGIGLGIAGLVGLGIVTWGVGPAVFAGIAGATAASAGTFGLSLGATAGGALGCSLIGGMAAVAGAACGGFLGAAKDPGRGTSSKWFAPSKDEEPPLDPKKNPHLSSAFKQKHATDSLTIVRPSPKEPSTPMGSSHNHHSSYSIFSRRDRNQNSEAEQSLSFSPKNKF